WAKQFSRGDVRTPLLCDRQVGPHIPHTGNAVGNEQRKRYLLPCPLWQPLAKHRMHMHVPKAGYEIFAAAIHYLRVFYSGGVAVFCDLDNSLAGDHNRHVMLSGATSSINDVDVRKGDRPVSGNGPWRAQEHDRNGKEKLQSEICWHKCIAGCASLY